MNEAFDPSTFLGHQRSLHLDPDDDWMKIAQQVSAVGAKPSGGSLKYIPSFPISFLQTAAKAGDALVVILIAFGEMRMRRVRELPIGPSIWQKAGISSKRIRGRLIRQIQNLPASLCVVTYLPGRPYLLVAGTEWPTTAERSGKSG
jgi:hypothetical protein